ncbi:urease accessory protein UreE [Haloarcula pelagica]|uniref:urease accessory protein UreE n=1 Tax=Haloarcula pelagica TaxID=3033389 RepID=UPI0024C3C40D|nr:urease accessory protein UreE [Halomicroarcula sp. YJ-61-S]
MRLADSYVGHRADPAVEKRLTAPATDPVTVVLSDTDRRRSRVRTETDDGRDLGVVVPQDLGDGDVLEADDGTLVVVELARIDALVLDLDGSGLTPTAALELGHALGNRHWDLALRDGEALFPVPDSRERMDAVVESELPAAVDHRYEAVPPTLFDDAGSPADHEHGGAHDHADHDHGHEDHDHRHSHGVHTIDDPGGGEP